MPRILLLPTPFRYVNPTWELLVDQLVADGATTIVGPRNGRSSRNLEKIIRDEGPFDVLLCDPWFFLQSSSLPEEYLPRDIYEIDIPIIVSLMRYDLHNLPKDFIDKIKSKAACSISAASSHDFFYLPNDCNFVNEPWLKRDAYSISSENVFNSKFILVPHCIGPNEFSSARAKTKKYDLIIPGVQYHFRRLVRDWAANRDSVDLGADQDLLQKLLGRLSQFHPFGNSLSWSNRPFGISLYQSRFRKAIARARVAVTCDGSINYPIRKFFEIPAFGTILAAKFFDRPERLGFLPGENCFGLTEDNLDELAEILELARSDSLAAERVREAGRAMVHDLHSVPVRARQLRDLCGAIASRSANTMIWKNGRPVLLKQASH